MMITPRGLDCALNGLRTGIRKEYSISKAMIHHPLRHFLPLWRAIEVGHMHQCRSLLLNRADQMFMAVAKQINSNTAREVQRAAAILTDQIAPLTLHRAKATPGINGHQGSDRHETCLSCERETEKGDPRKAASAHISYIARDSAGQPPVIVAGVNIL